MPDFDYVLVGGGLQNCLIALALAHRQPGARVAIVERSARVGGNHTWCFHAGDVPSDAHVWLRPLVVQRWPGYTVHFPSFERTLDEPYAAVTSERLHEVVSERAARSLELSLLFDTAAARVEPGRVELASGSVLTGRVVVDARGPDAFSSAKASAYQKFLGLEVRVREESTPLLPTVMDARVAQVDGLRFFYLLPLAPGRVLIEDTYFSDSPVIDRPALRARISAYAAQRGLEIIDVLREETGVLPLPTARLRSKTSSHGLVYGGYQGGWFHPTTGYSFPLALRLAVELSASATDSPDLDGRLRTLSRWRDRQQRFCTLLNQMLFAGFDPEQRFNVLERFYRLPAATVRRFYALDLTRSDQLRIVCGSPPTGLRPGRLLGFARTPRLSPSLGEKA